MAMAVVRPADPRAWPAPAWCALRPLLPLPPQEPIPTSLLKLPSEHQGRAVKMFAGLLRYCGDTPGEGAPSAAQAVEIAQKLLHQGLKRPELKDEL